MTSSQLLSFTTFAYLGASILYLAGVTFRTTKALRAATWVGLAAAVANGRGHSPALEGILRSGYGHAPLSNLYESLVFGAWCVMVIYLVLEKKTGTGAWALCRLSSPFSPWPTHPFRPTFRPRSSRFCPPSRATGSSPRDHLFSGICGLRHLFRHERSLPLATPQRRWGASRRNLESCFPTCASWKNTITR